MIDKILLKNRFSRSIHTYNKNAYVQDVMAGKLVQFLVKIDSTKKTKVLDLGCGTGLVSKYLLNNFKVEKLIANDISEDFSLCINKLKEENLNTKINFFQADLEDTFMFEKGNDLIISGSALQWVNDIEKLFLGLKKIMKKDAVFAFSTFGKNNLQEITKITGNGLEYKTLIEINSIASKYFEPLFSSEEIITMTFDTPIDVLKHLRLTGVNAVSNTIWTKADLAFFCEQYKTLFSKNNKLPLTFHPQYLIFKNK